MHQCKLKPWNIAGLTYAEIVFYINSHPVSDEKEAKRRELEEKVYKARVKKAQSKLTPLERLELEWQLG